MSDDLPHQSFCVSEEDHHVYQELVEQAALAQTADGQETTDSEPLMMTITPLGTTLRLSDPSWADIVNDPRGTIKPGPPIDISVMTSNRQMRALLEQLQPFYVKHWDPRQVAQA